MIYMKIKLFLKKLRNPDKIFLYRLFAVIIALDFISFFSLASLNPLQLLNPLKFLQTPARDERPALAIYFPKVKHELFNYSANGDLPKALQKEPEDNIVQLKQNVYQVQIPENYNEQTLKNAKYILQELRIGPKDKDIKADRLLKEKDLIKDIWLHGKNLIININKSLWENIDINRQKLIKICIEKSILSNITSIEEIIWYQDAGKI